MAVSVAIVHDSRNFEVCETQDRIICDVTFDASYPTGGEDFDVSTIPEINYDGELVEIKALDKAGDKRIAYDHANKKLKVYDSAAADAGDEVADTTDLSTLVARVAILGKYQYGNTPKV